MKYIKNHLMFILPLVAILLGMEFYLVFDRTTENYAKGLKEEYSMLVVAKESIELKRLKRLNGHIASLKAIDRDQIVSNVIKGIEVDDKNRIVGSLPYFYEVGIDAYVDTQTLARIKQDLEKSSRIKRVETFGGSYGNSYRLFHFIKLVLNIFIVFVAIVSLLLIVKQMEIWKYEHRERMQVMEIFGAPLMLRSGVLFKLAIIDALVATAVTVGIFLYVKFGWAPQSGIDMVIQNQEKLLKISDMVLLLVVALVVVVSAVYSVVLNASGVEES